MTDSLHFPAPVLLADIGGTNARFALAGATDAPRVLPTTGFGALAEAVAALDLPERPRSLVVCAAGPVADRRCDLTNAGWRIDGPELAAGLGLDQGLLLNDFEAQALALPAIPQDWTLKIGAGSADPSGLRLVLGPGTGLGVAALLRAESGWKPLASEAAHAGFGPEGAEQEELWPRLERVDGRVTAESLISGPGLARLHRARIGKCLAPPDVVALGLGDPSSEEAATIRLFWRLAARLAGDLAMTFMASGGVTLAGGVLPRLAGLLDAAEFRRAFAPAGPLQSFLEGLELRLVTRPDAVFAGLAALAARPGDHALDWRARLWR